MSDQYISYSLAVSETIVYREYRSPRKTENVFHAIVFEGSCDNLSSEGQDDDQEIVLFAAPASCQKCSIALYWFPNSCVLQHHPHSCLVTGDDRLVQIVLQCFQYV